MSNQTISLASLEGFMAARGKAMTLPAWLEDHFERDTRQRRARFLREVALWTCLIFNLLFAICIWLLASDVIGIALELDFFVVTPWILFVALIVGRPLDKRIRETAAASVPVVIALVIVVLYCITKSAYRPHAFYFVVMTMLGGNTSMRLRHVYAVSASVCALVLVAAAILADGTMPPALAAVQGLMLSGCAFSTLTMNEIRERDIRRAYLRTLRDRLKLAESDAQAKRDALTDLGNRHYLTARAAEIWARAGSASSPVAAVLLDVDHFKEFNDLYGHPAGDACLKRVAACVTAELRNLDDFAVRYGGEELLLLLPSTGMADAMRVAERVRRSIEALGVPHSAAGGGVVTASFGVSSAPTSSVSLDELISSADTALYDAKRNGRNQVCSPPLRDATPSPGRSGWAATLKRKTG